MSARSEAFLAYLNMPVERSGFDASTWSAGPDTPGLAWGEPDRVAKDVAAARSDADHVIVLLHSEHRLQSYAEEVTEVDWTPVSIVSPLERDSPGD